MSVIKVDYGEVSGGSLSFNSAEGVSAPYNSLTNTSVLVADITAKSKIITTLSYNNIFLTTCWSIDNGVVTKDFYSTGYENDLQIDITGTYLRVLQKWNTSSYIVSVVIYK